MSENIVFVKNAFEETPVTSPTLSTTALVRNELVEINNLFDEIEIPESIIQIAKTNELDLTWAELQYILNKLIDEQRKIIDEQVTDEKINETIESLTEKITYSINEHTNCPFTIQRLCELIIEPKKYYKMYIKYLRAIDKVLTVTSHWQDFIKEKNRQENSCLDETNTEGDNMDLN